MSTSFVEQLNLTPQERRIVVVIAVIVFFLLNWLLVWPHFSDLRKVRAELAATRDKIQAENKEIIKNVEPNTGYRAQLTKLQRDQGGGIGDQQIQLQHTVNEQAIKNGIGLDEIRPITTLHPEATNAFYEEQSVKIGFTCKESQLVNFLFSIGNDPAMIRVREINLRTADANRYSLRGDATLTANYKKKTVAAAAPATAGAPAKTTPAAPPSPAPSRPATGGPPQPGPVKKPMPGPPSPVLPKPPVPAPGARKNL
jgi:Tfp pilus assembly protein PilO